jgi:hypothetical protein
MSSILISLLRFELRYQLARPVTGLYALLIFAQGIWYGLGAHSQFGSRLVWINSAANAYLVLASPGLILTVVACLLAGQALTKDLDYRVANYAYAIPILDRDYFVGKLLGALLTVFLLALAYPLGTLAVPLFSGDPTGPVPVGQLLDGLVSLLVQNLFIIVGLAFSASVFTRSMAGPYVMMFGMVLYFLVSNLSVGDALPNDLLLLLDPFGVGMVRDAVSQLSVAEKNSGYLSYPAMLFINRILWLGLSFGVLAQAERAFSFMEFAGRKENHKARSTGPNGLAIAFSRLIGGLSFRSGFFFLPSSPLLLLARHELKGMIKLTAFQVVMMFLALLLVVFATLLTNNPDYPTLLTTARLTALREPLAIYVGLFLMVFSGELVFRERTVNIWAIYDTLPTSTATTLLAKLFTMIGLAGLLTLSLGLAGVGLQLLTGGTSIDWKLYALDLGQGAFLIYVQWIALAFAVAVLVNHRLASHVVSVVLLTVLLLAPRFGYESAGRWLYGWLPGTDAYSELSGYGAFAPGRWLFSGIWLAVAGMLVVVAVWGYNRGTVATASGRFRQLKEQFSWSYALTLLVFGLLAGLGQWQISQQKVDQPTVMLAQTKQRWAQQETQTLKTYPIQVKVGQRTVGLVVRAYHPQTVPLWQRAVIDALQRGTDLFGVYPYPTLTLTEAPATTESTCSRPGEIRLTETEGWTADVRQPEQLDHLYYVATREVLKQWTNPRCAPGAGLVENSLVEYLALQAVKDRFGVDRLRERLAQRFARYERQRGVAASFEPTLAQSKGSLYVERDRAALVFNSIGQLWGDKPLSLSIGQFVRQASSTDPPASLTSAAFVKHLTNALPDSLWFLASYLTERPFFDAAISSVHRLGDAIAVRMGCQKWEDNGHGTLIPKLLADAMPLVVLDGSGREIYRKMVWPTSQLDPIWIPGLPNARTIVLDPLGAWPDVQRANNQKII